MTAQSSKQCMHQTLCRAKTGGWFCVTDAGCNFTIPEQPETGAPTDDSAAFAQFAEYIAREMPEGTVIGDPAWWAPRLWRFARYAKTNFEAGRVNAPRGTTSEQVAVAPKGSTCESPAPSDETSGDYHGLDNARQVFFYEQDHYYLSNFSAFEIHWCGFDFKPSEHAYQWAKFYGHSAVCAIAVKESDSAHAAFKEAERLRERRRPDWDAVKIKIMRDILRAKAEQHEYVRRKLLQTGDRELIENSWRDDFWGWGPNRDGQNVLGKLWMEIRTELRQEKAGG